MATNSFNAAGGDGYPRLDNHAGYLNSGAVDAQVLRCSAVEITRMIIQTRITVAASRIEAVGCHAIMLRILQRFTVNADVADLFTVCGQADTSKLGVAA